MCSIVEYRLTGHGWNIDGFDVDVMEINDDVHGTISFDWEECVFIS